MTTFSFDVFIVNYCITASGSIFHQLLAAWKKRRKSPNLLKGLEPPAYQVSNKGAPLLKRARPSWKGRALLKEERPTATSNFLPSPHFNWTFPLHPTWPGTSFFYLHQQLIHPPSSHQGHGGTTYPSSHFEHGILWCGLVASVRPSNNITNGQSEPRSQWSLFEFGKRLNCEEICIQRFSCFSAGRGHFVLACLVGCL